MTQLPGSRTAVASVESRGEIAKWLRRRRRALGLTQKQVATAVERMGIVLSRGHYANLELGSYEPASEHVAALDIVMHGDGELLALAEREWGIPVTSSSHVDLVKLARSIHEKLPTWAERAEFVGHSAEDESARFPDELEVKRWWDEQPDGSFVVEGRDRVEFAMYVLLTMAASKRLPRLQGEIELSGAFEGFRDDKKKTGFPLPVRNALRVALERGWRCRHYIPVQPDEGPNAAALVYIAAPLMPCPNYEPLIVDSLEAALVENLMVVPRIASVQFYATQTTRNIDAAVIHKGEEASRILRLRLSRIASSSAPFVERFKRMNDPDSPELTMDEIEHRKFLAEAAKIEGPTYLVVDRWPTSTIHPDLYAEMVARRRSAVRSSPLDGWYDLIRLQSQRFDAVERQLERGFPYHIIIVDERLPIRQEEPNWKGLDPEERKAHYEFLEQMLRTHKGFKIGIASGALASRIKSCRWEVHDRPGNGVVVLHTHYTPSLDEGGHSKAMRRVDLKVHAAAAVRAFATYFRHVWKQTLPCTEKHLRDQSRHRDPKP